MMSWHRFFRRHRADAELREEMNVHLTAEIEDNLARGESPEEARRSVLRDFGGMEPTWDQCERQRPGWWIDTVLQDLRYALRGFRRNPLFTISVLVTVALGIGATTAVFSVVDRILFRAL